MSKTVDDELSLLEKAINILKKARDQADDDFEESYEEPESEEAGFDPDELGEGFREFNADDEESAGDDWLKENDPSHGKEDYEEYTDDEDEEAHRAAAENQDEGDELDLEEAGDEEPGAEAPESPQVQAAPQKKAPRTQALFDDKAAEEVENSPDIETAKQLAAKFVRDQPHAQEKNISSAHSAIESAKTPQELAETMRRFKGNYDEATAPKQQGRFRQPSREELVSMRGHTRPWEARARDMARLQADPSKNPVLHQYGNIIEARNAAHGDRKSAYSALTSSDAYKNADPIAQMEMDDKFETEWKSKNPEHLSGALKSHGEAHQKGKSAKDLHAATKDAQIRHILTGGAQSDEDSMSLEEALQHAGGARGEEGTTGTVTQDKASSFAHGNKEFIDQYAKNYANKAHKVKSPEEMMDYNDNSKKDISRILGPASAKDPNVEKFFEHYHPLIGMSAHKVVNKLGLDRNSPDVDMSMLHEAGMHGLMQAINDYDHDHPSGASFATHAGNKIKGLMHTALRNQDQIPHEVRQAQKKFASAKATAPAPAAPAPKVDIHKVVASSPHPAAPDMSDRLKRVTVQRAAQGVKKPGGTDV